MSGETFPTALWFKSYSENSRVLTVLWDTLQDLKVGLEEGFEEI